MEATTGAARSSLGLGVAVAAVLLLLASCANAQGDCRGGGDLVARCQQYVTRFSPKTPPSQDCCTAVQAADLPCLCNKLTPPIAAIVDLGKICYVASTCGGKMPPPGSKCGRFGCAGVSGDAFLEGESRWNLEIVGCSKD